MNLISIYGILQATCSWYQHLSTCDCALVVEALPYFQKAFSEIENPRCGPTLMSFPAQIHCVDNNAAVAWKRAEHVGLYVLMCKRPVNDDPPEWMM